MLAPPRVFRNGRLPTIAAVFAAVLGGLPAFSDEPAPAVNPARPPFSMRSGLAPRVLDGEIKPEDKSGTNGVVTDGVLVLRGRIDQAMRERFMEAVNTEHVTTVKITSPGGEILEALNMANVIQARGIDVVVHGLCTGACAQYILVAGKQRRLEKESLVGFMITIKSAASILGLATDELQVQNKAGPALGQLAALEEDLYRRSGVSTSLLMDPHVALQPRCVTLRRSDRGISWNMNATYIMWVPTRAYLEAAGLKFEGDWPKSRFWLGGRTFHYLKLRSGPFVRFGDKDPLRSKKDKPYSLDQVQECVLEEVPETIG
jgi:hypothetical protein